MTRMPPEAVVYAESVDSSFFDPIRSVAVPPVTVLVSLAPARTVSPVGGAGLVSFSPVASLWVNDSIVVLLPLHVIEAVPLVPDKVTDTVPLPPVSDGSLQPDRDSLDSLPDKLVQLMVVITLVMGRRTTEESAA